MLRGNHIINKSFTSISHPKTSIFYSVTRLSAYTAYKDTLHKDRKSSMKRIIMYTFIFKIKKSISVNTLRQTSQYYWLFWIFSPSNPDFSPSTPSQINTGNFYNTPSTKYGLL